MIILSMMKVANARFTSPTLSAVAEYERGNIIPVPKVCCKWAKSGRW